MNIYDEALAKLNFELRGGLYEYYEDEDLNIPIKALERAKKVEELLNKIIDELKQIEKLQDRNAKISKIIYGDYGLPKYQNIEHEQKQNEYTILYYPFNKIIKQLEEELK